MLQHVPDWQNAQLDGPEKGFRVNIVGLLSFYDEKRYKTLLYGGYTAKRVRNKGGKIGLFDGYDKEFTHLTSEKKWPIVL